MYSGESEAEVTNNKRLCWRYCTVEANHREAQSIVQPLCQQQSFLSAVYWTADYYCQ